MKMTKRQCIANILIGFGSILNIAPVVATTPLSQTNAQLEANELIRSSWAKVGEHLKQAYQINMHNEQ